MKRIRAILWADILIALALAMAATAQESEAFFLAREPSAVSSDTAKDVNFAGANEALFVENDGQWADEALRFAMRSAGANIMIYDDALAIQLQNKETMQSATVRVRFLGARDVRAEGIERSESVRNYFRGAHERWRAGVATYGAVVYRGLYEGIDFVVAPITTLSGRFLVLLAPCPGLSESWRSEKARAARGAHYEPFVVVPQAGRF